MLKTKRNALLTVLIVAFIASVLGLFATVFAPTALADNNLLINGDFAIEDANWTATGITLSSDNFVTAKKSGAESGNALKIEKTVGEEYTIVSDVVNITDSGTYTFMFRYRTELLLNAGDIGSVYLTLNGNKIDDTETKLLSSHQIWQRALCDYSFAAGSSVSVVINVKGSAEGYSAIDYHFADFSLKKISDVAKNGYFEDYTGDVPDGWEVRWKNYNYAALGESSENPYGSQSIVGYDEYSSYAGNEDNGKVLKIVRNNKKTAEDSVLVNVYPSFNEPLVTGYVYRITYKVWYDGEDDSAGTTYFVISDGSGSTTYCGDVGGGEWKEKSFTYTCTLGHENPNPNESSNNWHFRLVSPKTTYSEETSTLLFTQFRVERIAKSNVVEEFSNGNFKALPCDGNNYPEQVGILNGTGTINGTALRVSNAGNLGSGNNTGVSIFAPVYAGGEHQLSFGLKFYDKLGDDTFNTEEAATNFRVMVTYYSDINRTPVKTGTKVSDEYPFDIKDITSFASYSETFTVPASAKFADISFISSSSEEFLMGINKVSFGLIDSERNLSFEYGTDNSLLYWTFSGDLTREEGTREGGGGSYVAKIGSGTYASSLVKSAPISVSYTCDNDGETDDTVQHHYELSYWIKADMDFSASVFPQVGLYASKSGSNAVNSYLTVWGPSEDPGDGLNPYTRKLNNINFDTCYATYGSTTTATNPDGWVYQRVYFQIASDTKIVELRFIINGEVNEILLDDVSLELRHSYPNLDFEETVGDDDPASWYMSQARDENPQLKVVDDVYHSGSHSLYANVNALVNSQYIYNPALLSIDPSGGNNIYEVSFWVASRNSDVKSVQLDVWFHGEDGVKIYSRTVGTFTASYKGTIKTLNAGSTISEWSQVITRVPIEKLSSEIPVKYISLNFTFTTGKAEVWIDDISIYQAESDDYITNFAQDAHAVDKDGNISGWSAVDSDGKELAGALSQTNGGSAYEEFYNEVYEYTDFVTMAKKDNAYLLTETDTLFADYQYKVTVLFKSDYNLNLKIKSLNYMREEYSDGVLTTTLQARKGCWVQADYTFSAHSATFTQFMLDNGGQGEFSVAVLRVEQVGKPSSAGNWHGSWITYKDDFRYCDEYASSYYRGYVDLSEDKEVVYAPLQFTGDDKIALWVNGELVVDGTEVASDTWASIKVYDIVKFLKQGERNSLAFEVFNAGAYSAMIYDGIWKYDDGEQFYVVSDKNVRVLNENDLADDQKAEFEANWYKQDYTGDKNSPWKDCVVKGSVPMDPWGAVYYDSSLYIDSRMEVKVVEGDNAYVGDLVYNFVLDIKPEKAFDSNIAMTMTLGVRNSTKVVCDLTPTITENGNMKDWKVGEWNRVKFTVNLPDYLSEGSYTLQLSEDYFLITNTGIYDNKFISFRADNEYVPVELETKVENINGVPTFTVNGEPKAAYWYVYSPSGSSVSLEQASKLGIETLVNFDLDIGDYETQDALWLETGAIDYDTLDKRLNTMVAANPDGNIIVTLGIYAPQWWLDSHPGQVTAHLNKDGTVGVSNGSQVSYGSDEWKEASNEVIEKILAHMREQTYYSKVAGFRITAGGTAENIIFDSQTDDYMPDYSDAALAYFRKWAEETYKDIVTLRTVWNDDTIESFETIEFPTAEELRYENGSNGLYDPVTQQKCIDFKSLVGVMVADNLTTWAKTIKEATDYKLIVGCYYGYLWAGPAYGVATQGIEDIYSSPYLDFFFSPMGYNERQLGEGEYAEAVADSARAYGKLFISEQDNRTCVSNPFAGTKWNISRDYSVGVTHTFNNSILQQKRDAAYNLCNGNGQWHYDMLGGWFNDAQLQEMTTAFNAEFNYTNYLKKDLLNDIAIIIPDTNSEYSRWAVQDDGDYVLVSNSVRTTYMYKQFRKHLDKMGAGFDVYALSTMTDGKVPDDYKVYFFFNPYVLTQEDRDAIDKQCKKDGKICIFLMESGWGWNTDDVDKKVEELAKGDDCKIGYKESYMTDLTGFNIKVQSLATSDGEAGQVVITDDTTPITAGLKGLKFGAMTSSINYFRRKLWVEDDGSASFKALGVLATDSSKIGLAMKQMPAKSGEGEWTSIWCAAPYLSQEVLRGIISCAGIHSYTTADESDLIVWSNNKYVGAHSATSGTKKIYLDGYYSVYDVYEGRYVSMNTNVIEYENAVNDTHLFRLGDVSKYSVLVRVSGGHGSVSDAGLSYVDGGSKTYTVTPDEGYVIKSVIVNGEETTVGADGTFTLENINDSYQVVVQFKRETVPEYIEDWDPGEESVNVPDWIVALISVVVLGGIVAIIVYKNFFKKGVRK